MGARLAAVIGFLLETVFRDAGNADDLAHVVIAEAPVQPENATDMGTTEVVQVGGIVITVVSGSGPTAITHFTGWMAAGGN